MKAIIRMLLFNLALLLLTNACSLKQNSKKYSIYGTFQEEPVYVIVDESSAFSEGMGALMKYLAKSIRYPHLHCCQGVEGRVIISFIVAKDGSIHQVKIARGLAPYYDKEAVRVIKAMPKWKPAKIKGKTVHQRYVLPIHFRLI